MATEPRLPASPTPHSTVATIITGHFNETASYRVWRPGGTRDWLLIYTVSGAGRYHAQAGRGRPNTLLTGPGDVTLFAPGAWQDYGTAVVDDDARPTAPAGDGLKAGQRRNEWELLWAHFQPRDYWGDLLRWPPEARGLMRVSLGEERHGVEAALRDMHTRAQHHGERSEMAAANALEWALILLDRHNPRRATPIDRRLSLALDYASGNLHRPLRIVDLAEAAGMSSSRFSHLFRSQLQTTPAQWLERRRLARAGQLLRTTPLTLARIAEMVGYESPFYLSLRFKRAMGVSPSDYRGRRQNAPLKP